MANGNGGITWRIVAGAAIAVAVTMVGWWGSTVEAVHAKQMQRIDCNTETIVRTQTMLQDHIDSHTALEERTIERIESLEDRVMAEFRALREVIDLKHAQAGAIR